jgi:hypothetical protein
MDCTALATTGSAIMEAQALIFGTTDQVAKLDAEWRSRS